MESTLAYPLASLDWKTQGTAVQTFSNSFQECQQRMAMSNSSFNESVVAQRLGDLQMLGVRWKMQTELHRNKC